MGKGGDILGVLLNDVHLTKDNGSLVKDIFKQAVKLCKERGSSVLFCSGDAFTNRSGQPLQCLMDWKEILLNLQKNGITLHIIPGNHDKTDSDDERSYLDVYSMPCVKLYSKATRVFIGGGVFAFIPYFSEEKWLEEFQRVDGEIEENLQEGDILDDMPIILISHFGADGVRNNDGSKVSSRIKPSLFEKYTCVLVGHYHDASQIGENIFYTGSAYQNNYGENITDKGFTVIHNDGGLEFVPSKFPMYIKETIRANDKETLANLIEKYEGDDYNHIRFVFVGKKTDLQNINVTEIQTKYGIDCKFESDEEIEAIEHSDSDAVLIHNKKTVTKNFLQYCGENQIRGDKLKYGLELIKKIKHVES